MWWVLGVISANINFQILLCYSPILLFSFLRNSFIQFRILLFPFEFCYSFFWFYYAITNFFIQFPILLFAFELCYAVFCPILLFDCTVLSCSLESYYFLSNSVGYLSNSIMPLWVLLFSFQFYYSLSNYVMQFSNPIIRLYSPLMYFRILLFPFKFCWLPFQFYYVIMSFFNSVSNSIIRFRIMFFQIRGIVYLADGALGTSNKLISRVWKTWRTKTSTFYGIDYEHA